jgi:hypothetical protein
VKTLFAASSIILAIGMLSACVQDRAPVPASAASAAPDAAAVAAANDMLTAMKFRALEQNAFAMMRQSMPASVKQAVLSAIYSNPALDPAQKKRAVDDFYKALPRNGALIDGVFRDPAVMDKLIQETAEMYARQFTADELRQFAAFYKTPAGAKMATAMPQVLVQSGQINERVVMPRITAIMQNMLPKEPAH